jgi:hypothetical protein
LTYENNRSLICYIPNALRPQMHSGASKRVWGSQIQNASRFVRNASRDEAKCIWGNDLLATNRRGCSKFSVAAALPLLL